MPESIYNEECAFLVKLRKTYTCRVLKSWYNSTSYDRCKDCPFFKTHEQLEAQRF